MATRSTNRKPKTPAYPCRDLYSKVLEARLGEECLAEWYFHPTRKWRMDYAFPKVKVAIEIDGGIFIGGRHSGGMGQKKDFEKLNSAAELGWLVFHYTPDEKMKANTFAQVYHAIQRKRQEQRQSEE